jgi:hypothetical protein
MSLGGTGARGLEVMSQSSPFSSRAMSHAVHWVRPLTVQRELLGHPEPHGARALLREEALMAIVLGLLGLRSVPLRPICVQMEHRRF